MASDHIVRTYYCTYRLYVTANNYSNNYGLVQNQEKLIPLFIQNTLTAKELPIYGDGKNIRDWLFVEGYSSVINLILEK